jgi:hypothetical protein
MIYIKLISGLGNQLFQYAIGRQIAIERNVELKLDLSFFENQSLRSFRLDYFNIEAEIASISEVKNFLNMDKANSLSSYLRRKTERYLPKYRRKYFKEDEWWVYEPDIFKVSKNTYIDGYWQHYKYYTKLPNQILREITLKNECKDSDLCHLIDSISNSSSSVSIHVRRGDYITDIDANNLMGVLPITYYNDAIRYIKNKVNHPCFYIFSDDLDWVKKNMRIDAPTVLVDIEDGNKDYIELDVMSRCKHNIIANSSFSWWGAFLNKHPAKIVIAPSKWVVPKAANDKINLQLPNWVTL